MIKTTIKGDKTIKGYRNAIKGEGKQLREMENI